MTTVYLVRHAHSEWAPSEDRPLSEQGRLSAQTLADRLEGAGIGAIYTSPARRAYETIHPLAVARGIQPVVVADLRERELVVPPGMTFASAVEAAWTTPDVALAGGESNHMAAARGLRALRTILDEHENHSVTVASHGNLLALIVNALDSARGYEFWKELTFPDVYRLRFEGGDLRQMDRDWPRPVL